jgi:hypothetical protein
LGGTPDKRKPLAELNVDRRVIFKWVSNKMWTGTAVRELMKFRFI